MHIFRSSHHKHQRLRRSLHLPVGSGTGKTRRLNAQAWIVGLLVLFIFNIDAASGFGPSNTSVLTSRQGTQLSWGATPNVRRKTHFKSAKIEELARGGDESTHPSTSISYYLLWSGNMMKKTVISILIFGLVRIVRSSLQIDYRLTLSESIPRPLLENVFLPLLSSACCAVQLLINVVVGASGCAGFNKRLGPLRPYFLGLLATVVLPTLSRRPLRAMAAIFLALLPELVHVWNRSVSSRKTTAAELLPPADDANLSVMGEVELDVPTMGCVACINKIDSSIRARVAPNLVACEAWLEPSGKGGKAHVKFWAASPEEVHEIAERVTAAVQDAGFPTDGIPAIKTTHRHVGQSK